MKKLKQYVLVLLIASFLAISSLGIGVTVITNASEEDSETVTINEDCDYTITVYKRDYVTGEGLEDWSFSLYVKDGNSWANKPLADGTTNETGYLIFEGLCSEQHYKVQEEIKDGWTFMGSEHYYENHETDVEYKYDEDGTHTFSIQDKGQQLNNVVVTFYNVEDTDEEEYGDISVFKFYDNQETLGYEPNDGDHPLEDWHFELFKKVDGVWESMEEGWTNDTGYLIFRGYELEENYMVTEYLPNGWYNTYTEQKEESIIQTLSYDIVDEQISEESVTFTPYGDWHVMFGNAMLDGSITVHKLYEQDESGLEGWTFNLWSTDDEEKDENIASGTTDDEGQITFEDVYPGEYIVEEELEDGWYNVTRIEQEVTVYPGENTDVWFFNDLLDGSITVYKFYDYEMTGEYDEEIDDLLEGWTFNLWTAVDGDKNQEIAGGTTDVNGEYTFEDLYPGEYIVEEELQDGWMNTTDLQQLVTVYPDENSEVWFGNVEEELFGEITVYKFYDSNYNGEFDDEEEMIDGFMFQLWAADEDGNPTEEIGEAVNTMEGMYTFEELEPGNYVVQEIIPEVGEDECCWLSTTDLLQHVEIKAEGMYSLWFGNVRGGRIEGMKFLDIEADGYFDVGLDKPLMDWEINLWTVEDGVPGEIIETTETNRDGMYYFNCVMPGEYFVQEEMYEGWYNNTADILHVDVEPCETVEGVDFSNCMYKEIYGIKFYDYNMDGEFNEEDWVLEGWEINLWNEIDGEPGEIIDTFFTQPNGYYFFDGIKVGTYYVQEEVPYGWDNTTESIVKIEFNCCSPKAIINFGNYEFPEITINKFNDANMDGVYSIEDGDYLLADQTVNFDVLGEFEGVQIFAQTYGVDGSYNFLVPIGDFNVTEMLDIGWLNTTPLWQEQTLGPGDHWEVWFGNVQYGDIEVYKFYDYNMNGMYDKGEEMLEGWTFNLWNTTDEGQPEAIIATNVTDEDGLAMFESLESGLYAVQEIVQDCWFPTTEDIQYVEVEAGNTSEAWFGNVPGGSIEGYKFCDYNMNERFDKIEIGLEGWVINLYEYHEENGDEEEIHSMHEPYMTTETDEDGYYNFSCIKPGMYILEEVLPEGWYNTTPYYYEIEVLPEGELWYNFGNYRHGDIVGLKYYDFDMNGEFDPEVGDIPLRGKTVELWEADVEGNIIGDEPIAITETDEHGYYIFEDNDPGDYVVYQPKACCEWEHTTPREVHVRLGCVEEIEVNYGEYQLSSIDVYVKGGMEGIGVTIYESDEDGMEGSEVESGESGDHGWYISEQLEPGYYLVVLEDGQYEHVQLRMGEQVEFEYEEEIHSENSIEATYAKIE
ncbi:MAG: MSCRAMM family protein [Candidatus Natronoplasma sp.]